MPTACRLSQTLGRAKSLIMKARLSLVASHALSHKLQGCRRRVTTEALLPVAAWFPWHRRSGTPPLPSRREYGGAGSEREMKGTCLGTAAAQAQGQDSSRSSVALKQRRSHAFAQPQKRKVISSAGHAVRTLSLGMLRHPSENTNTKQGGGSPSAA